MAHRQAFRQATDARLGARRLPTVSLGATSNVCYCCFVHVVLAQSAVEDVANTERRLRDS